MEPERGSSPMHVSFVPKPNIKKKDF
jgi:hypothetical protein